MIVKMAESVRRYSLIPAVCLRVYKLVPEPKDKDRTSLAWQALVCSKPEQLKPTIV